MARASDKAKARARASDKARAHWAMTRTRARTGMHLKLLLNTDYSQARS